MSEKHELNLGNWELFHLITLLNDEILRLQDFEIAEGRPIDESSMSSRYPQYMSLMKKLMEHRDSGLK